METNECANNSKNELQVYSTNSLINKDTYITTKGAILDSGACSHYIAQNYAHILQKAQKNTSVHVNLPNRSKLSSQLWGTLSVLNQTSYEAAQAHVMKGLDKSLLPISKVCDA